MIIFEDKYFKIIKSKNGDFVLVRKGKQFNYNHHSHFKSRKGCNIVMNLFHKKLIPKQWYFKKSMERITTEKEYQSFKRPRKKLHYRNDAGRGRM